MTESGSATPEAAPSVSVDHVVKVFQAGTASEILVLDDVSLAVEQGEVVALLGPSGCGKSTLLRILGGLIPATRGSVAIDGEKVTEPSPMTGMMFQRPVLFPWLTVLDNVLLPTRVRGAKNQFRDRALELIETVGLEGFEKSYPWQLSGGMQQRVAISRMLINEPRVLLLDEPFGALDEMTREYMDSELRSVIVRANRSAILVTHNPLEAAFIADRVVVLTPRPGRIAGMVQIALGRERPSSLFASDALHGYVREVRVLLEEHYWTRGDTP